MNWDADEERGPSTMHEEDIHQILRYLDLPIAPTLPTPPLDFLAAHIHALPTPLLQLFSGITTPRQRTSIRGIKSRRLIYASSTPPPPNLTASLGRLRWPLLWERMGGSSLPPPPTNVQDEEVWVKEHFLPGSEGRQHVKKLGGFLRGLEEEREWEEMAAAKRAERRSDEVGEEFDEESDEEEKGEEVNGRGRVRVEEVNQEEVKVAFERKLLELFINGMDTISYDEIDFAEPAEDDPIAIRDAEDHYFDEESPNGDSPTNKLATDTGDSPVVVDIKTRRLSETTDTTDMTSQNGKGEYDY